MTLKLMHWYLRLWHKETGLLAKVLCLLGLHDWRFYSKDWDACNRCPKVKEVKNGNR